MNASLALAEPEIPEVEFAAQRILIAEDEAMLRHLAQIVLSNAGYETHCVANGADAWDAAQTMPFDLLITDNSMPQLSGLQLIQKLRANNDALPIILASGTLPSVDPELGVTAVLQKPYSSQQLLQSVQGILRFQKPASGPSKEGVATTGETLKSLQRLFFSSKTA